MRGGGGALATAPRTTRDRTYARIDVPDPEGRRERDQVLFHHPNGLVVVCLAPRVGGGATLDSKTTTVVVDRGADDADAGDLAPSASASASGAPSIVSVDFSLGKGKGHQSNDVVKGGGKKKRGAKLLMANSGVARVTTDDGTSWTARACAKGRLLEVNERLIDEPGLASTDPLNEGFLCVVQPRAEDARELTRRAGAKGGGGGGGGGGEATPRAYDGFFQSLRRILRREGVFGLYKGMVPNVLRTLPSSGMTFLVYESTKSLLSQ